ncbi:hypothetical protein EDB19DRAFT_1737685 [Suillus lakei]|nr:hypothetical protein EDB19DRAFT_1737685 [Suillus lakei]
MGWIVRQKVKFTRDRTMLVHQFYAKIRSFAMSTFQHSTIEIVPNTIRLQSQATSYACPHADWHDATRTTFTPTKALSPLLGPISLSLFLCLPALAKLLSPSPRSPAYPIMLWTNPTPGHPNQISVKSPSTSIALYPRKAASNFMQVSFRVSLISYLLPSFDAHDYLYPLSPISSTGPQAVIPLDGTHIVTGSSDNLKAVQPWNAVTG